MPAMTQAQKQKRYRERQKVTKSDGNSPKVTKHDESAIKTNVAFGEPNNVPYPGGPDCECGMCQNYRAKGKSTEHLNHGPHKTAEELGKVSPLARNRQSLPGDADYGGQATAARAHDREAARADRAAQ